jgi:hypothetical protein
MLQEIEQCGLEAVTLCFPPTAGESIVKEKTIKTNFQRKRFKAKGYNVKYFMVEMLFLIIWKISFQETDMISLIKHTQRNYFDNIWVFVMKICTIAIGVMNKEAKENKPSLII